MQHYYIHTPLGHTGHFELFAVDEKEGTTKHKETIPSFDVFREKYPEILARYVALRALPPVTAGGALGVHVQDNLFLILDPSIR